MQYEPFVGDLSGTNVSVITGILSSSYSHGVLFLGPGDSLHPGVYVLGVGCRAFDIEICSFHSTGEPECCRFVVRSHRASVSAA